MSTRRFQHLIRAGLLAAGLLALADAQDLDGLATLVPGSLAAMRAEKWEEALGQLTRATAMTPAEALRTFGPQFGVVWYRRGICEMKLQRWVEAMHSFETCYRDYPNRGPTGGNLYQTKALLKWGESAVGAQQWELAISRFRKFLEERDKARDSFQQGAFHITFGICHYRLGHIPEGNEQLEIAIRNRAGFPTSDEQIMAGIQALTGAAIAGRNEAALVDFLANNRTALVLETHHALTFAPVYLKLASDAEAVGLHRAALALYQQVVDPAAAAAGVKARLASPGDDKEALEAALKALEEDSRSPSPVGLLKLAGMAGAQEACGDLRTAVELRERLGRDFPESPLGAENRRRLARLHHRLALAAEGEGRKDEAIANHEKAWMEGNDGVAARAARRWMELVWERNRGDDRVSACRGGLSFLEAAEREPLDLSDDDRAARDEVRRLTLAFQAALAEKARTAP